MSTRTFTRPPAPPPARPGGPGSPQRAASVARLWRGRPDDPAWVRPSLLGLLSATALLYLWGLSESGWANAFYAAAVQAGSSSWKAFFFGASDAAGSITVDKTPASLWVMDLSARIFGVNSWSVLVPQALEGVAAVGLLYATVRRRFTPVAGLLAGAVMALTPVAVLMFRFDNPDALLVLLLVAAAWATLRALETASTRFLVLAGAFIGLGFLTKMLQAFVLIPVLAAVYLFAAPTPLARRLRQVLAAAAAVVVSAGWWVAIVAALPASDRPYIGGSQTNSIIELTLGYNGFGRLTGSETGSVGGGAGGGWGQTGITRLFGSDIGGQVSWLIPASLLLLVAGLVWTRRAPRTDLRRAGFLLWGGWLLVTGLIFSFMGGIFHPYYTVALAPAIGALVGMGAAELWARRSVPASGLVLAGTIAVTTTWSVVLLRRSADWNSWLAPTVLVAGLAVAAACVALAWLDDRTARVLVGAGLVVALAGPAAYSVQTAGTAHSGSIPSAGPTVAGAGFGGGGSRGRGGLGGRAGGFAGPGTGSPGSVPGTAGGVVGGGFGGGFGGPAAGGPGAGGRGGGFGGLLDASTPSAGLVALLKTNASSYTWVAAAVGSNNAAGVQLAVGQSVMPIGGFNGSDPSPTLAQFEADVAAGRIHYFIGGSGLSSNGGSSVSSEIAAWVAKNFTATTVGGSTVYDLTVGHTAT